MHKIFKCDCGTHLVQIDYSKADTDLDLEDLSIVIYDVYNPDTGRKYKNPKLIGDTVLANNKYPEELDNFFNFITKVVKNRKKQKKSMPKSNYVDINLEKYLISQSIAS